MDIRMPDLDGLAATRQITADESLAGVKVLILTTFEVDEYVFEALRVGRQRVPRQGSTPGRADRGDPHGGPRRLPALPGRDPRPHRAVPHAERPRAAAPPGLLDALTDREREIVALVATGMSNAEIADHLTLSPLTVKTHANHAMTKLGARDRAQLVVLAYQAGLAGAQPADPQPSRAPASWPRRP